MTTHPRYSTPDTARSFGDGEPRFVRAVSGSFGIPVGTMLWIRGEVPAGHFVDAAPEVTEADEADTAEAEADTAAGDATDDTDEPVETFTVDPPAAQPVDSDGDELDDLDRDGLVAVAEAEDVKFHPNTGERKLRAAIRAHRLVARSATEA